MPRPSAGMVCIAPTGRVFLMRRSQHVNNPFYWSIPAGRIEPDETAFDAAQRELEEETGYARGFQLVDYVVAQKRTRKFHCFIVDVPVEFRPKLNWENDDAGWFEPDALPNPLHPGLAGMLDCL